MQPIVHGYVRRPEAEAALQRAIDEARSHGAKLVVLHSSLLGEQRAAIVERLRERPVSRASASSLRTSGSPRSRRAGTCRCWRTTATSSPRRVKQERGRPVARYRLSEEARRLFPQRYASVAGDLHPVPHRRARPRRAAGVPALAVGARGSSYTEVIDAEDLHDRLEQLADALSRTATPPRSSRTATASSSSSTAPSTTSPRTTPRCAPTRPPASRRCSATRWSCPDGRPSPRAATPACAASPRAPATARPSHRSTTLPPNHHLHDNTPPREESNREPDRDPAARARAPRPTARERQQAVADDLSDYKFGWSDRDDQYSFTSKRGLTRETVAEISELKDEPAWMRDLRLRAYEAYLRRPMPNWGADLSDIALRRHLLLRPGDREAGELVGGPAGRHQEHLRPARHPRGGEAAAHRRRRRPVRVRGRLPQDP
jgi:hypothetical protein